MPVEDRDYCKDRFNPGPEKQKLIYGMDRR